jgi:signal transduction histidine kinase
MSEFEGSGIGMATAKKIVELHGGTICASAREGHGATFRVTLTLEDQHNGSAVSAV